MEAFPNLNINVKDESTFTAIPSEDLPLHRPIYPMRTEKGPMNIPVWCPNVAFAKQVFGDKIFNAEEKLFFGRASVFLLESFENNGGFIARVGDITTMKKSAMVISVNTGGVVEKVMYTLRPLAGGETFDSIAFFNGGSGGKDYPLFGFEMEDYGVFGNEYGVRLFIDNTVNTQEAVENIGETIYSIGFTKQIKGYTDFDLIKTKFSKYKFDFVATENVVDPTTGLAMDYVSVSARYFDDTTKIPAKVHVYTDHINTLLTDIKSLTTATSTTAVKDVIDVTGGHMKISVLDMSVIDSVGDIVNLGSGLFGASTRQTVDYATTLTNYSFDPTYDWDNQDLTDPESERINSPFHALQSTYFDGGDDGNIALVAGDMLDNNDDIDDAIIDFFDIAKNPQIQDKAKFPFNTIGDIGYSVNVGHDVKSAIINVLTYRKDVKVVMSTWSGTGTQDEAASIAAATSIINEIRLIPESEVFGTGAFRANVFGQTGVLNDTRWNGTVPLTIWYMSKLAEFHNLDYIKAQPAGLPNSAVEMFKSIDWTPIDSTTKRSLWESNINYCQNYDMTHIHFPGLKSVYKHDTSVLATDSFTNTVIYVEQLSQPIWAKYAGIEDADIAGIYARVTIDMNRDAGHMLAGLYDFDMNMYQTAEEALLGYVHHIDFNLTGGPSQRVWNMDIICKRPNFEG